MGAESPQTPASALEPALRGRVVGRRTPHDAAPARSAPSHRAMTSWILRNPIVSASALVLGVVGWFLLASGSPAPSPTRAPIFPARSDFVGLGGTPAEAQEAPRSARPPAPFPDDPAVFDQAARVAWAYAEREYQPATGWINSVASYPYGTAWDIASGLAALYCGNQLGFLPDAEYDRRMRLALHSLVRARLFDGVAFNKNYSTRTGAIAGRNDRDLGATARGYGWSASDIGRLLVWLHVIRTNQPRFAPATDSIVKRLHFDRMVAKGYLWGETVGRSGRNFRYVEGRIPYEQYSAAGFAAWGARADSALSLHANALPVTVMGVPLVADRRGYDHLTSDPFLMSGLELGWTPEMRELAARVLEVQRERYGRTGQVTVVNEDAMPQPPYYFYYYSVNLQGRWFAVGTHVPSVRLEGPRWISAKGAYGWHALLPSEYTRLAVDAVARASHPGRGWSSGVYERSGRPTLSVNLNTAAVILEAALYRATGRPLVEGRGSPASGAAAAR